MGVEDQRIQIGTLKSTGIFFKSNYGQVFYLLFPCRYSWLQGLVVGNLLIPQLNLYGIWCNVSCTAGFDLFRTMVISVFGNYCSNFMYIICFILACYNSLRVQPAILMRPKAPKTWQNVSFWNEVKFYLETFELFTSKVTARNLFRVIKFVF